MSLRAVLRFSSLLLLCIRAVLRFLFLLLLCLHATCLIFVRHPPIHLAFTGFVFACFVFTCLVVIFHVFLACFR